MLKVFVCVKERVVWYILTWKYIYVTVVQVYVKVVQVYAPTEDKADEETHEFFGRLGEFVWPVKRHDMLLIMGDFNTKIEQEDGICRDFKSFWCQSKK